MKHAKSKKPVDTKRVPLDLWALRQMAKGNCSGCGEPFGPDHPLSIAPKCCGGGLMVTYHGDHTVYLTCFKCGDTIMRLELANRYGDQGEE